MCFDFRGHFPAVKVLVQDALWHGGGTVAILGEKLRVRHFTVDNLDAKAVVGGEAKWAGS